MRDAWDYTGLKALNSGQKVRFLCRVSDELYEWTKDVTETHDEFPVGYTEWTLTGHMNIVANRCDFMPYSDYVVKLVKGKRKIPAGIARPDLHIHSKGWEDSWIFELKRDFISLTSRANMGNRILAKMQKAYGELRRIAKGHGDWSHHGCSALAFTVWIDWLVNGKDRWQTRWIDRQKYEEDWDRLWHEKWEAALLNRRGKLASFGRVYYSGYRMPHSLAERHHQTAMKEAVEMKLDKSTLPVAVLWIFAHKLWSEIPTS